MPKASETHKETLNNRLFPLLDKTRLAGCIAHMKTMETYTNVRRITEKRGPSILYDSICHIR